MSLLHKVGGIVDRAITLRSETEIDAAKESFVWRYRIGGAPHSRLTIGTQCHMTARVVFERSGAALNVGDRSHIGGSTFSVAESVTIGSDVLISWGCVITDHNSHSLVADQRRGDGAAWKAARKDWTNVKISPVEVHDDAWIGVNAIILPGVVIGEGAIVAAGAVVTRSVEPYTLVAGNPARSVRSVK